MKRELAFALMAKSQILDSIGRTRSNKILSNDCNGVSDIRASKKVKRSVINDPLLDCSVAQIEDVKFSGNECNRDVESLKNHSPGSLKETNDSINRVENTTAESSVNGGERDDVKESLFVEAASLETGRVAVDKRHTKKFSPKQPVRRFTRSALKLKEDAVGVVKKEENSEMKDSEGVSGDNVEVDEGKNDEGTLSAVPDRKLELKMTKKITMTKIPQTVKEVLETGLLEGYPVYYDHGKKGPGLRGTIRGVGILCSCGLCQGCRVVTPSLFEIHACNSYRRAAQYICLENGRSFIEVLNTCRRSKLSTLEATIQDAIGPLPQKEMIVCHSCKESFLSTNSQNADPLCNSCMKSKLTLAAPVPTSCEKSGSAKELLRENSCQSLRMGNSIKDNYILVRPSEAVAAPKSPGCPPMSKSLGQQPSRNLLKESRKPIWKHTYCSSPSVASSSKSKMFGKITKKDLRMHKLVFGEGGLPDGTELGYYARGKRLLDGYKKGDGIFCLCCNSVVSASQFEAHAGCASRKKPYCYIYTSNGVSLHELSISLACRHSFKNSDDLCMICADGGNLVICDLCPRVFHPECASLTGVPRGKWYCQYCQNMFEREKFVAHNVNAVAAGRVSGADPIEEINKRCIRIVKDFETDVTSCILCRGFDFSRSGFGQRTILICDQCEKEYHVGCLREYKMADLKELPKGNWFCSISCGKIHCTLQNLLVQGAEKLPDSLLNVIRKKHVEISPESMADLNMSWRLINGKIVSSETKMLLSQAIAIFHDGFSPIIDGKNGHDLIPAMVYGNLKDQEYKGMYCAVLTVNSQVVSAAVFRVFGREIAELPLVATINGSHGKGYFQTLFACIEQLFAILEVKNIVLPAAEEAKSIWTDRFGFKKMTPDEVCSCRKTCWSMVSFQGTVMLRKPVPPCRTINSS
ncbi:hypothetical protein Nepgr_032022 [Nepenthes gracilis]|uniref:PHD-type domain-containing protein n=1 Tax=Nepenthes gracilis TaxID=150966 RepID=A0AAD3Y7J8_NEPGR|nr:hypothetical protein Nepgr_032022 [Nepenthes gracilis]